MKSTLNLPPLAVIIALSLGGALAGVLGALIGVPTAALIAVILDEYVVRKEQHRLNSRLQTPSSRTPELCRGSGIEKRPR